MASNNNIKKINKILKERGMKSRTAALALRHSNQRTNDLNKLRPHESEGLINLLNEFTDEVLLKGIHDSAKELQIIIDNPNIDFNENLIVSYLKQRKIIDLFTNEIETINPIGRIVIKPPFSKMKYVEKEFMLVEIFMPLIKEKRALLN